MANRFFSLMVIPDSGSDVKSGSFNFKLFLWAMSSLAVLFLVCLFFITGYHIKLSQEQDYKAAVSEHKTLLSRIEQSGKLYIEMTGRLAKVQHNDKAFRNFNRMTVYNNEAYQAGIGGHSIIDTSQYDNLEDDLRIDIENINYGIVTTTSKLNLLEKSFGEIQETVKDNRDIFNNTPSILPTRSIRFTSSYGWRTHPVTGKRSFHNAVDVAGHRGQDIFATADGVVQIAKKIWPLGNCVKIKHKYGYVTTYGHLNSINVKKGQTVKRGDVIGGLGRTGRTTGLHIHYGISLNGRAQNPKDYF